MKRACLLITTLLACSPAPRAAHEPAPSTGPDGPPAKPADPAAAGQPPEVRITAERTYEVGAEGLVSVTVHNRRPHAIVVDRVRLTVNNRDELLSVTGRRELTALSGGGGVQIRATHWIDNPGPEARGLRRPKWTWAGSTPIVMLHAVPPNGEVTFKATLRPRDAAGGKLVAGVAYTELAGAPPHYRVASASVVRPAAGEPDEAGMRADTVRVLKLERLARAVSWDETIIDWPLEPPRATEETAYTERLLFMLSADVQGLSHDMAVAEVPLVVTEAPFTLAAARAKAGIEVGPAARVMDSDFWVVYGGGFTWVVGADEAFKVVGDAIWLVESLNDNPAGIVMLHVGDAKKDPGGHLAHFKRAGVAIRLMDGKDGSTSAVAEMTRRSVVTFLRALSQRKLRIDGKSHRVEPM
jgi:hypothetical protein